jgi:hypothetical protein
MGLDRQGRARGEHLEQEGQAIGSPEGSCRIRARPLDEIRRSTGLGRIEDAGRGPGVRSEPQLGLRPAGRLPPEQRGDSAIPSPRVRERSIGDAYKHRSPFVGEN